MSIRFACKGCGKRFEVGNEQAGKRVRCKDCGEEMRIPDKRAGAPPKKEGPRSATASSPPSRPRPSSSSAASVDERDEQAPPRGSEGASYPSLDDSDEVTPWRGSRPGSAQPATRREQPAGKLPKTLNVILGVVAGLFLLIWSMNLLQAAMQGRRDLFALGLFVGLFAGISAGICLLDLKLIFLANEVGSNYVVLGSICLAFHVIGMIHAGITQALSSWNGVISGLGMACALAFMLSEMRYARTMFFNYAVGIVCLIAIAFAAPRIKSGDIRIRSDGALVVTGKDGKQFVSSATRTDEEANQNKIQNEKPPEPKPHLVRVIVSGLPSDDAAVVVSEKIQGMLNPRNRSIGRLAPGDGTVTYTIYPLEDTDVFANAISFGTVTKVEETEIWVDAAPVDKLEIAAAAKRLAQRNEERNAPAIGEFKGRTRNGRDPGQGQGQRNTARSEEDLKEGLASLSADPLSRTLAELRSEDIGKRKSAARRLAGMPAEDDRCEEVTKALLPLLDDNDGFLVNDVISAMVAWRTTETVMALIPKVSDSRFNVRWHAIESLGLLGDPRAAKAIAGRLREDGIKAQPALKALGPAAEPALIALLQSGDSMIRRNACDVLADVGGIETLKLMRKARPDPDIGVRMAAQSAMRAIAARVGDR